MGIIILVNNPFRDTAREKEREGCLLKKDFRKESKLLAYLITVLILLLLPQYHLVSLVSLKVDTIMTPVNSCNHAVLDVTSKILH